MRVALETALGVSVGGFVAGQVPDDQGLVAGSGQEHVGARKARVSFSFVFTDQNAAHFSSEVAREVTQPLWPSRVPRRISCSAMMGRLELEVWIEWKTSRLGWRGKMGERLREISVFSGVASDVSMFWRPGKP